MRLDEDAVRQTSADARERWARRCAELTPQQWSTATRCTPWDVRGLVSHRCPDLSLFDMLNAATTDGRAAVADAAEMPRRFNALAESLTPLQTASPSGPPRLRRRPGEAVTRFTECAEILRATTMSNEAVISCPVLGSTTSAVIAEVALME